MEIPGDYYLDSLNELEVYAWLYRTEGSDQIHYWHKSRLEKIEGNIFRDRLYFKGIYRGKEFFAKQFLKPNLPHWSIRKSVEYQFENLLLFADIGYVPEPLFLTKDTLGMQYVKGETIKNLAMKNEFDHNYAKRIILELQEKAPLIIDKLQSIGRSYDCSYNNILVKKDGEIVFVDFDYAENARSVDDLIKIIHNLKTGAARFGKNGELIYRLHIFGSIRKGIRKYFNI